MTDREQREGAATFAAQWKDRGYEKGESQPFWLSLLRMVYGVDNPEQFIEFEDKVKLDHTSFIDAMIPSTHVMIEQKELGKNLRKAIRQSDGTLLNPYQQAMRYSASLPYSQRPRYIVTCNFSTFLVYDMEHPQEEPQEILLENLPDEYYRLNFLVDAGNAHLQRELDVSIQAGELVGQLYDALQAQYIDPDDAQTLRSLNVLCVRLVFCLYAEDAGIFGSRTMFHDYLQAAGAQNGRRALIDLFHILDTETDKRDPYEREELLAFPYVNGGLFADESIVIPQVTDEIIHILTVACSEQFDWSDISPTIFGAVFESTLNPETRRHGGMHYTSIENIHKVIDPLFLDELHDELNRITEEKVKKTRHDHLLAFQEKLAGLQFLDPACGSGNFLTETYLSLRRLENKVLDELTGGQMVLGELDNPIRVSISQFYGIEINDFAVTVAKTALWIAESQMMKETEAIVHMDLDFLPLKTNAFIHEGNALRMNWEDVVPKDKLNYIMGNPPFVGYSLQSKEQKEDIRSIYIDEKGKPYKTAGKIDYVAGWYFKAAQFMYGTAVQTAFVSTNSITQGEQVAGVWKPLYDRFHIHIDFAWRTFKWGSESSNQAAVHCVIVGFSEKNLVKGKYLYDGKNVNKVENISPYLVSASTVFIQPMKKPLCDVPEMTTGNRPADGGHLIIEVDEYDSFIAQEPAAKKFIKRLIGAEEYINGKMRYCLWLVNVKPDELRRMPLVRKRIEACREARLASPDKGRRKLADIPALFRETKNPPIFIVIPRVSSEKRRYIPLGFDNGETIATDSLCIIPNSNLYYFGVLTSNVHMAWMRAVAGRLKSDYRYSKDIVYNNFPWPLPTEAQKKRIEQTAQAILDARAKYPDSSLADLYDELTMPPELRKAHQENDKAVMTAYGWNWRGMSESDCVAELMKLYQKLTEKKAK